MSEGTQDFVESSQMAFYSAARSVIDQAYWLAEVAGERNRSLEEAPDS
jgi:hypothetical protein